MKVSINLQEGFYDDEVLVFANEKHLYEAKNVSTRMQIGLAASFEAELPDENTNLRIDIPTRNISEKKEIPPTGNLHVGISITGENKVDWKISETPFFYA